MSEIQVNQTISDKIELPNFDLPQNYSILINKLEQLALGLDTALGNLSLDHKEIEIAVGNPNDLTKNILNDTPIALTGRSHAPPSNPIHNGPSISEVEYSRVVSDIWIGVILTLLIVSVIFFICSCFLYHKFKQWKSSYRTNPSDQPVVEICRHYSPDFEAESLPSYTIVSGLPTYDDALEEFRKAGIILTPAVMPVIKIFENEATKDKTESDSTTVTTGNGGGGISAAGVETESATSTCNCNALSNVPPTPNNSLATFGLPQPQVIELSPEQLAALSRKRLSLQITFNNTVRRNSRPRIDLCREVNYNNMMRSHALSNALAYNNNTPDLGLPQVHAPFMIRSSSSTSLTNERLFLDRHLRHSEHRGSLC